MKIDDIKNKIINGDTLTELKKFPDESVNCIITSPPYFNLRDYQIEGQIGLEETWQEYIRKLLDIFNEVKRILKKDGTCFVNLGDSFAGSGKGRNGNGTAGKTKSLNKNHKGTLEGIIKKCDYGEISDKSLMMIPERFAIAMIDQKWILRNKLVWIKRNAMPESVQDRWKKAHEYIFFFVKNKKYYFDLDAIRTPHKNISIKRAEYEQGRNALGQNISSLGDKSAKYGMPARVVKLNPKGAVPPDFLDINTNCRAGETMTEHYATYPMDLINPLIKAGSKEGDIILDIFNGSGTSCVAAKLLNRNYIGIDLNKKYCDIATARLKSLPNSLFDK